METDFLSSPAFFPSGLILDIFFIKVTLVVKNPPTNRQRHKRRGFDPWVGKIPWRRAWQPAPVFLPGGFYGQGSLTASIHRFTKSRTRLKQLSMHTWWQNYSMILLKKKKTNSITCSIINLKKGLFYWEYPHGFKKKRKTVQ